MKVLMATGKHKGKAIDIESVSPYLYEYEEKRYTTNDFVELDNLEGELATCLKVISIMENKKEVILKHLRES